MPLSTKRRMSYFNCEDLPKWSGAYETFILPNFRQDASSEAWSHIAVASGDELPPHDSVDAVLISGSHYCVRDGPPFQDALAEWVRVAVVTGYPRVMGVCYGAQLIAHALGGRVGANPGGAFVIGAEALRPTLALAQLPAAKGLLRHVGNGTVEVRQWPDRRECTLGRALASAWAGVRGGAGACNSKNNDDASSTTAPTATASATATNTVETSATTATAAAAAAMPVTPASPHHTSPQQQRHCDTIPFMPSPALAALKPLLPPPPLFTLIDNSSSSSSTLTSSCSAGIIGSTTTSDPSSSCVDWTCDPLRILESHGDCVWELPIGATLLASSASCAHEAFLVAPTVIGIQGHPELSALALLERIWPAVVVTNKRLDNEEAAAALESLEGPRHAGILLELFRRFLRGEGERERESGSDVAESRKEEQSESGSGSGT